MKGRVTKVTRIISVFLALLFMSSEAQAERFSGSFSSGVDSEYLVKPGFIVYNKPMWWNNLRLEYDGWYVNLWGSLGIDSERGTFGDEGDITIGKKFTAAGCNIDISGSYFALADIGEYSNDLYIFDAHANFPEKIPWITPWVAARYFGSVGENSPRAGWFGWVGFERLQPLGFQLPLQDQEFAVNFDAWAAFSMGGAFGGDAGPVYTRLKASTKIIINEDNFITPWIMWHAPIQGVGNYLDGEHHFIYGISFTHSF